MKKPKFLNEKIVSSIVSKTGKTRKIKNLRIISFYQLYKLLDKKEIDLIKNFLKLNPRKYGFRGKFLGIKKIPSNLVTIKDQFLPKLAYLAYQKMNKALKKETGKKLLIASGYRSPAYQAIVFLRCLKENKFDFLKTAKGVAFPGYSEHGNPVNHAIDFCPENFEKTEEYKWLIQNANKYGFYLSYPEGNGDGVMFEPWHWRFSG
ncbi:M15 family metallopeptidase [Patescibacteria group bacterium]|nr:M15 family metallopeptidase [Patescibacteria group bacterium]